MFASIHRRHRIAALAGILSVPLFRPTKIAIVTWCLFRATRRITDFLIRQIPLPSLPPVVYAIPGNWGELAQSCGAEAFEQPSPDDLPMIDIHHR